MLSQHKSIDRARRHASFGRQGASQPRRVEECTTTDYLRLRQTGVLKGEVGEDINRVGNKEQNSLGVERLHVRYHALQNRLVAANQICARFSCTVGSQLMSFINSPKHHNFFHQLLSHIPFFCFAPAVTTMISHWPASAWVPALTCVEVLPW